MQGARNGPRMDEDPVGPRRWVAGGPVWYKHGMRDETEARGWETTARGDWADDGMWHRGTGTTRGGESESAKQKPRGIGKQVAMEW